MAGCTRSFTDSDQKERSSHADTHARGTEEENSSLALAHAVVPVIMPESQIVQNPYLSDEEAMIHNDIYSSDVTVKAKPLGIHTEIIEGVAKDSKTAPPCFFYDNFGKALAPITKVMEDGTEIAGGIAIRDMDDPELSIKGRFIPALDDNGSKYGIQILYSFVDKENHLVGLTTNGHLLMIDMYDDKNEVLPIFEKKLDVDVISPALKALGEDVDQKILSIVYDYEGNLWFATGGFRKNPAHSKPGMVGYLEREYIDRTLAGEKLDAAEYLHFMKLRDGENAENAISTHPEGVVILTNQNCYLFEAGEGVQQKWSVSYESKGGDGKVVPVDNPDITGIGLAWGGGSSPTLTNELVLFTDNQDVVNLITVDIQSGKVVAKEPVLNFDENVIVSVENSICVYSPSPEKTSVLICNWFGAGSPQLLEAGADSSIQTFDNIYDAGWRQNGSKSLMPGIERIDLIKKEDGTYEAEEVWCREDLKDTSMIKFSTVVGAYYGYTQLEETGEWGFIILDYDTGKTLLWQPVSTEPQYNNSAVGIIQGATSCS